MSRIGSVVTVTTVRTLTATEATLGYLGVHIAGVSLPTALLSPELVSYVGCMVPLGAIRLPAALDGHIGINRGDINCCRIGALNDYQVIQIWLSLRPAGGHT